MTSFKWITSGLGPVLARGLGRRANVPTVTMSARQLWGRQQMHDPFAEMRSTMREMEKSLERLMPSWGSLAQSVPLLANATGDSQYRLAVDLYGFRPEEIRMTLKERMLTVEARTERHDADGTRFYHETSRQYLLPEELEVDKLTSTLGPDGVLRIEAPLPAELMQKKREIPIQRESDAGGKKIETK